MPGRPQHSETQTVSRRKEEETVGSNRKQLTIITLTAALTKDQLGHLGAVTEAHDKYLHNNKQHHWEIISGFWNEKSKVWFCWLYLLVLADKSTFNQFDDVMWPSGGNSPGQAASWWTSWGFLARHLIIDDVTSCDAARHQTFIKLWKTWVCFHGGQTGWTLTAAPSNTVGGIRTARRHVWSLTVNTQLPESRSLNLWLSDPFLRNTTSLSASKPPTLVWTGSNWTFLAFNNFSMFFWTWTLVVLVKVWPGLLPNYQQPSYMLIMMRTFTGPVWPVQLSRFCNEPFTETKSNFLLWYQGSINMDWETCWATFHFLYRSQDQQVPS